MNAYKLDCAEDIIKIADRVKKILYDKQVVEQKLIVTEARFPKILEHEAAEFLKHHTLAAPEEDEEVDSMNESYERSQNGCFSVREEDEEDLDEADENNNSI